MPTVRSAAAKGVAAAAAATSGSSETGHLYVIDSTSNAQYHLTVELLPPPSSTSSASTTPVKPSTSTSTATATLTRVTGQALLRTIEAALVPLAPGQPASHHHSLLLLPTVHGRVRREIPVGNEAGGDDININGKSYQRAVRLPNNATVQVVPCQCTVCVKARQRAAVATTPGGGGGGGASSSSSVPSKRRGNRSDAPSGGALPAHGGGTSPSPRAPPRPTKQHHDPLDGDYTPQKTHSPQRSARDDPPATRTAKERDPQGSEGLAPRRRPSQSPPLPSSPQRTNSPTSTTTTAAAAAGNVPRLSSSGSKPLNHGVDVNGNRGSKDAYYTDRRPSPALPARGRLASPPQQRRPSSRGGHSKEKNDNDNEKEEEGLTAAAAAAAPHSTTTTTRTSAAAATAVSDRHPQRAGTERIDREERLPPRRRGQPLTPRGLATTATATAALPSHPSSASSPLAAGSPSSRAETVAPPTPVESTINASPAARYPSVLAAAAGDGESGGPADPLARYRARIAAAAAADDGVHRRRGQPRTTTATISMPGAANASATPPAPAIRPQSGTGDGGVAVRPSSPDGSHRRRRRSVEPTSPVAAAPPNTTTTSTAMDRQHSPAGSADAHREVKLPSPARKVPPLPFVAAERDRGIDRRRRPSSLMRTTTSAAAATTTTPPSSSPPQPKPRPAASPGSNRESSNANDPFSTAFTASVGRSASLRPASVAATAAAAAGENFSPQSTDATIAEVTVDDSHLFESGGTRYPHHNTDSSNAGNRAPIQAMAEVPARAALPAAAGVANDNNRASQTGHAALCRPSPSPSPSLSQSSILRSSGSPHRQPSVSSAATTVGNIKKTNHTRSSGSINTVVEEEGDRVKQLRAAVAAGEAALQREAAAHAAKLRALDAHMAAEKQKITARYDARADDLRAETLAQSRRQRAAAAVSARERRWLDADARASVNTVARMRGVMSDLNGVHRELFALWAQVLQRRRCGGTATPSTSTPTATATAGPPMTAFAWQRDYQLGQELTRRLCESVAHKHVLQAKSAAARLHSLEQRTTLEDLRLVAANLAFASEDAKGPVRMIVRLRPAKDDVLRLRRLRRMRRGRDGDNNTTNNGVGGGGGVRIHHRQQQQQQQDAENERRREVAWGATVAELLAGTAEASSPLPFDVSVSERAGTVTVRDPHRGTKRYTFTNVYGPLHSGDADADDVHGGGIGVGGGGHRYSAARNSNDSTDRSAAAAAAVVVEREVEADQRRIFAAQLEPALADTCLRGRNLTVIGYGATGSGKTHTLLGASLSHCLAQDAARGGGAGVSGAGSGQQQSQHQSSRSRADGGVLSSGWDSTSGGEEEDGGGGGESVLQWCISGSSSSNDDDYDDDAADDGGDGRTKRRRPVGITEADPPPFGAGAVALAHPHRDGPSSPSSPPASPPAHRPRYRAKYGDGLLPRALAWLCNHHTFNKAQQQPQQLGTGNSNASNSKTLFYSRKNRNKPHSAEAASSPSPPSPEVLSLSIAMFEVYNDRVYDLLADPIPEGQDYNVPYKKNQNTTGAVRRRHGTGAAAAASGGISFSIGIDGDDGDGDDGRDNNDADGFLFAGDRPWDDGQRPRDAFEENPRRLVELIPFHDGVRRGNGGTGLVVDSGCWTVDAKEVVVARGSYTTAMRWLRHAAECRRTCATSRNTSSSRSHMFVRVRATVALPPLLLQTTEPTTMDGANGVHGHQQQQQQHREPCDVQMTFCDLAGSERLDDHGPTAAATLRREAKYINRSLCAVADVLGALSRQATSAATARDGAVEAAKAALIASSGGDGGGGGATTAATATSRSLASLLILPPHLPDASGSDNSTNSGREEGWLVTAGRTSSRVAVPGGAPSPGGAVDAGVDPQLMAAIAARVLNPFQSNSNTNSNTVHGSGGATPHLSLPTAAEAPVTAWPAIAARAGITLSRVGKAVLADVAPTGGGDGAVGGGRSASPPVAPSKQQQQMDAEDADRLLFGGNIKTSTVRSVTRRGAHPTALLAGTANTTSRQPPLHHSRGQDPTGTITTAIEAVPFRNSKVTMLLQQPASALSAAAARGTTTASGSSNTGNTFLCFSCISPCSLGEVLPPCAFAPVYDTAGVVPPGLSSDPARVGERAARKEMAAIRAKNYKEHPVQQRSTFGGGNVHDGKNDDHDNSDDNGAYGGGGEGPRGGPLRPPSAEAMLRRMSTRYERYGPLLASEVSSTLLFSTRGQGKATRTTTATTGGGSSMADPTRLSYSAAYPTALPPKQHRTRSGPPRLRE